MESCDIVICGARARIRSNDGAFARYVRVHFAPVLAEATGEPELVVTYLRGEPGTPPDLRTGYVKVCRGVYAGERNAVWNDVPFLPGLRMTFSLSGGPLQVEAVYAPPRSAFATLKKAARAAVGRAPSRQRFYFEILYNIVYYPVFWRLRGRGVFPMHAGGAIFGGRAVVVAGAQGTGKSTIIAQLLAGAGSAFVSDNILLYDDRLVHACHEPLRIDPGMLESMPHLGPALEPVDVPVPLGRRAFNVARSAYRDAAAPDVFIVPRLAGAPTRVRPITPREVAERIRSFNTLADEIRSFEVFASALRAATGAPGLHDEESRSLHALLGRAKCYEMTIRYGEHPAETAAALEAALAGDGGAKP